MKHRQKTHYLQFKTEQNKTASLQIKNRGIITDISI